MFIAFVRQNVFWVESLAISLTSRRLRNRPGRMSEAWSPHSAHPVQGAAEVHISGVSGLPALQMWEAVEAQAVAMLSC